MTASMVEIYNEEIKDLLGKNSAGKKHQVGLPITAQSGGKLAMGRVCLAPGTHVR